MIVSVDHTLLTSYLFSVFRVWQEKLVCDFSDPSRRPFLKYYHIIEYHILQWLANRAALADRNEQYLIKTSG